jgi:hypothetical protein
MTRATARSGLLLCAVAILPGLTLLHAGARAVHAQQPPFRSIGVLQGPQEYTFGWIEDVEVDGAGRIIVLDTRGFGIRWYHADGRYGGPVGRGGQGPGEFRRPSDMAIDSAHRLHVLDPGNDRISIYEFADDGLRHVTDQRRPVRAAVNMCAVGNRRFLLSTAADRLLHEIDEAGRLVGSFGTPPQPDRELAREFRGAPSGYLLAAGTISCDERNERILFASTWTGEVRMYDLAGALVWRTALADFDRTMMKYNERLAMCCQMGADPRTGTYVQAFAAVRVDDTVVVSLSRWRDGNGSRTFETRILRAADGLEIGRAQSNMILSQLLTNGERIGYASAPFPHVRIVAPAR